jgi:ABC-type Mn2+/Zn2+ transport system ATPase subunit
MRLRVSDLTVSFNGVPALRSCTFEGGPGELVGVVGPNGAGKSTLLRAVLGLVRADTGTVAVDGQPVNEIRPDVAYLPQRSEIDWDYPAVVEEIVAMGRFPRVGLCRRLRRADHAKVAEALERMGLVGLARRPIGELSGGQQQRTFVARALAQEARLLLLDEPFAGVDALTETLLRDRLREIRDDGATLLVVHHDLATVSRLYDRVLLLSRRVIAYGDIEEALTAETIAQAYGAAPTVPGLNGRRR